MFKEFILSFSNFFSMPFHIIFFFIYDDGFCGNTAFLKKKRKRKKSLNETRGRGRREGGPIKKLLTQ